MIKEFKFFQHNKTKVFTDYMDQMDDYFLGGIQPTIQWRTANGLTYPINTMSIDHIVSVVRCMNGDGNMVIPNPYEGRTHTEWYEIFHNEMLRRRGNR
jgi:hypothetical protein